MNLGVKEEEVGRGGWGGGEGGEGGGVNMDVEFLRTRRKEGRKNNREGEGQRDRKSVHKLMLHVSAFEAQCL